jgi:hypothetical protein
MISRTEDTEERDTRERHGTYERHWEEPLGTLRRDTGERHSENGGSGIEGTEERRDTEDNVERHWGETPERGTENTQDDDELHREQALRTLKMRRRSNHDNHGGEALRTPRPVDALCTLTRTTGERQSDTD